MHKLTGNVSGLADAAHKPQRQDNQHKNERASTRRLYRVATE
jgi:hypothetical protein